jgi:hypothetical protein
MPEQPATRAGPLWQDSRVHRHSYHCPGPVRSPRLLGMTSASSPKRDSHHPAHHDHATPSLHPLRRVMAAMRRGFDDASYLNERLFDRPRPW